MISPSNNCVSIKPIYLAEYAPFNVSLGEVIDSGINTEFSPGDIVIYYQHIGIQVAAEVFILDGSDILAVIR